MKKILNGCDTYLSASLLIYCEWWKSRNNVIANVYDISQSSFYLWLFQMDKYLSKNSPPIDASSQSFQFLTAKNPKDLEWPEVMMKW